MTSKTKTCKNNQIEKYIPHERPLVGKICIFASSSPLQLLNIYIYICNIHVYGIYLCVLCYRSSMAGISLQTIVAIRRMEAALYSLYYFTRYVLCSLLYAFERSVVSNTKIAWTPPLAVHSQYVALKSL